MLSFLFAATLALRFYGASAASQTFFPNSTALALSGPTVTKGLTGDCSNNCVHSVVDLSFISWFQMAITATYTAETVVLIVNKRANSTRTTTISNTEIDFAKIAKPTNLNIAGTVTTSVIDKYGSTIMVAYPTTVLIDYAPNITWRGTLSTTVSGTPTCSIAPTGAVEIFPSHPHASEGVQATGINTIEDPRGLTFVPVMEDAYADTRHEIENLFPGLGVWNCEAPGPFPDVVEGPAVLQTALYLTTTSTSTELDDWPTSAEAPASRMPAILEPASKSIVITSQLAPAPTLPTTPVAVPVRVTATNAKGSITISTSTALAHPIIVSSTNAEGSLVTSTSLSTAPISASIPSIITSTNAQGIVISSTTHLPAIILTTTNAAGSKVLTTSTLSLFTPASSVPAPIIINSETITPNAQSQYIVSSQTLSPGSSITLGSGTATTVLALQTSSGSTALVYGPSTSLLPLAARTEPAALTIGSQIITPNAKSQYLISGSTLVAGSTITLGSGSSTTVLALQTSGSQTAIVFAPSTSILTPTALATTPPAITIGSETITANSQTQYIVGSQTLTAGGVVTVSGTEVSLAAGESDVVVGSSTEALAPFITAGLGSGPDGTTPLTFAGGADGRRGWREVGLVWMVVVVWL